MTDPREPDSYLDLEEQAASPERAPGASAADINSAKTGLAHSDRALAERQLDLPAAPPRRRPLRLALLLVGASIALAALTGLVAFWVESERREGGVFGPSDEVLLMVQVVPSNATLYVDGVKQHNRSLQLSRQRKQVVLRAEAAGYRSRQMLVKIDQTTVIQLTLTSESRAPRATRSPASSRGTDALDRETVLTTLRQLNEPMRQCFIAHGQPGTVLLRATLHPDGHATGKISGSFARTKTSRCVLDKLRQLRTPRFTGRAVAVDFPFVLK